LSDLVDKVLDLSKINHGDIIMTLEPVAPGKVVREMIDIISGMASSKSISIDDQTAGRELSPVIADRTRLGQVLLNLLSNAVKFSSNGRSITVQLDENTPGLTRFWVEDDGRGVPENLRARLFVPFDRLGLESQSIEGAGLGLAIVKDLLEHMDGEIGYEPCAEGGSKFWFTLPQALGAVPSDGEVEAVVPTLPGPGSAGRKARVLYIEDNPFSVDILRLSFDVMPGAVLLSAEDAEQGIEMALAEMPDLILMDIGLPGMDGIEATQRLKAMEQTRNIPVIALSAQVMPVDRERTTEAGFHDYISKPFNIMQLLQSISVVLDEQVPGWRAPDA
jgi:CheY-like chemotaxis protein